MKPGGDTFPTVETWYCMHNTKCGLSRKDNITAILCTIYARKKQLAFSNEGQSLFQLIKASPAGTSLLPSTQVIAPDIQQNKEEDEMKELSQKVSQLFQLNKQMRQDIEEKLRALSGLLNSE